MNKIKVGNTWRNISVPAARVNGSWRPCKQVWVKKNGTWTRSFDLTEPDPFDGSGSLTETPGNVPWQQLSGTWTLGSGVVTASDTSNRVAAVDAGTPDITINIDASDANQAGEGVAFWIQDQLNWWGLKTFYNFFSFTTPSNQFYNHFCNAVVEYQTLTNTTKLGEAASFAQTNYSITGYNYTPNRTVRRVCSCTNGNVTTNAFTVSEPCLASCSGTDFPTCSKTSCGTQNRTFCPGGNCVSGGTCPSNVPTQPAFYVSYNCPNTNLTTCPSPGNLLGNTTGNAGTKCSVNTYVAYSCNFISCSSCTYSTWFTFSGRYFATQFSNGFCTGPAGTNVVYTYSCILESVRLPPNTTNVYETRLQLIRSQAGSVNVINSQSYSNMGNVYASTSGNQITARAYSSTGQAGTLYGPWTYDAGSVPRGNKHGILISAVPYQQTFSISRFKADL